MLETIGPYVATLLPTAGVAFLFYWIIRYMLEADRRERKAIAAWRKEHEIADGERPAGQQEDASRTASAAAVENTSSEEKAGRSDAG